MVDVDRFQDSLTSEGRYRLLVNAITDYAIYMLDQQGVVTSWNPGAERFKGYKAIEIVGRHFSAFYTDEDRAQGIPEFALAMAATEGHFETEGLRVRKDGTRFWAHVVIDPVRSPGGALLGYAKITRDLTERRAHEEKLRLAEQQFGLLVQSVTDYAIYMLDAHGKVANWNAGAERIKGYTPREIVGQHFSRFYTDADRAQGLPARGLDIARREGRWEHEGKRVRKDGSEFWAQVVIDAIRDDSGAVIGFAKVTRDITERRAAQAALDAAREALFQSQKMDALGRLTGGIAHDFNNLLAAVLGSLELVRKRLPEDRRITPLIDNAMQGAQRGALLTERMLAFARKQELKPQAVDIGAIVIGMLGILQRSVGHAVRIETRMPAGLPLVRTDPTQLETALLNLAVNARDAMPSGGAVTIAAERDVDAVILSVSDTGSGMDKETLEKALEPFFTTKGVGRGTGLGLSMVHGLAAQSGGSLILRSAPDEGTSVILRLPVATAADTPSPPLVSAPPTASPGERAPMVILVVDDDALVLLNTAALLEDLGHRVISAASGIEALEALAHHPAIDLVITDQVMPGISGVTLRGKILEQRPNLPVLIATGYAEMPAAAAAIPRLNKPFTQAQLATAVLRTLAPQA